MKKILLLILLGALACSASKKGYQMYGVVGKLRGSNILKACLNGVEYYLYGHGIAPVYGSSDLRPVRCDTTQGSEKRK